jgi:hypothetical protein
MIVSGIAATAHTHLQGFVLLGGAIDVTRRDIPLYLNHQHQIGEVTHLMYCGHDLHCIAETDDAEAQQLGYFSVAARPLAREQRGNLWHVSRARLIEISLVKTPANDRCQVLSRKESSPFRALQRLSAQEHDLYIRAFETLARGLQEVCRHVR